MDKPLLILPAGADEFVPATLDRKALLRRWISACKDDVASALSDFIKGAHHVISGTHAEKWHARRLKGFLESV